WKVDGIGEWTTKDIQQILPFGAMEPTTTEAKTSAEPLIEQLEELDKLRAGDKTPWEEIKKRTNELLAKFTAPADKGRIHWQAVQIYSHDDFKGHKADVIRHAQEALKYVRDPVQRGSLFTSLGLANTFVDSDSKNFVACRAVATRWYLKGYAELLPFHL